MFQTKNKVLKNLTQQEVINLLDTKKLTIEELINIKQKIITELENRNNNELEIASNFKSFKVTDFSLTKNDTIIDFIITEDGLLLGIDKYLIFYIGKVDKNLNTVLFQFDHVGYKYLVFKGKIDSNHKYYHGDYWYDETSTASILNKFDFCNCDSTIYNEITDQKIPNIKTQIQLAYQEQSKKRNKQKLDTLLSVLSTKKTTKTNILKRTK